MLQIAEGWQLEVERGPDWLIVRLHAPGEHAESSPPLAERIWALLEQHFIRRLVIELDELPVLTSYTIGQLILLHKRVDANGGLMRICGISPSSRDVLRISRLEGRFSIYENREAAIIGHRPPQPR
jgi:stage II sporulation protein AA (anti-sigma F factor antagonist)